MKITPLLIISLNSLNANRARTGLTVLGMVIGIASVIIVYSAGEGINSLITEQIDSFGGSDLIETEIKVPSTKKGHSGEQQSAMSLAMGVAVTTLTLDDMEDINELPNITGGYAGITGQEQVSYRNEMTKSMLLGVTATYIDIDKSTVESGRFFTEAEDRSLSRVVVLGRKMSERLFGVSDPIGKFITIRRTKFRVIGVMAERGAVMTFDFDDMVYVPIRTLQKRIMGINHVLYMMHQVEDTNMIDRTAEEMRYILRENHGIEHRQTAASDWTDTGKDDFRVVSMVEAREIMDTVTGAITLLFLAIVAISLIVGGVGIMNIMYVAVNERTSEIGLRKAVGAKYSDIMLQFLAESVMITLMGGVAGILFGITVSALITWGAVSAGFDWKFSLPLQSFAVALGFSLVFGIAFGLYPARRAARMQPVEALRSE